MEAAPSLVAAPSSGVLLVTQDFPPDRGGIQTYCREIVQQLAAQGIPVRVLCPTPERRNRPRPRPTWPPRPTTPEPATDEYADQIDRWRIHGSFLFAPMVPLIRAYLRRHPEIRTIVYAQWQSALWHLFRPNLAAGYRRLCLVHGRELMNTVFGPLTRPLARRVLNTMDEVLPVSSPVQRLVQQLAVEDRRVRLLPPGVDPGRFRPMAARDLRSRLGLDGAKVVLSISRLVRRKNLDGLMRAFARVRERFPDSVLVIAGEGPERERLESQAMLLPMVTGGRVPVRFLGAGRRGAAGGAVQPGRRVRVAGQVPEQRHRGLRPDAAGGRRLRAAGHRRARGRHGRRRGGRRHRAAGRSRQRDRAGGGHQPAAGQPRPGAPAGPGGPRRGCCRS